jgi:hypothetical protein
VTVTETRDVGALEGFTSSIQWSSIIGGAITAAAVAFVLHGFATGIGVSISSTAPTWRDASFPLVFLSGLYLLLVAVVSYGVAGYIAARLRAREADAAGETAFRDGMHGLLAWGLATLLTGVMALAVAQLTPRLAAPEGSNAGPATSIAGENIIAYDLDRLFRGERPQTNINYARAEAGRILLTVSSHNGMTQDDRNYLVQLVAATTGLSQGDADRRVADVAARAKADIDRARHAAAILAFMAAAVALLGAAVAWFAACAGGRHRQGIETVPAFWDWTPGMTEYTSSRSVRR